MEPIDTATTPYGRNKNYIDINKSTWVKEEKETESHAELSQEIH